MVWCVCERAHVSERIHAFACVVRVRVNAWNGEVCVCVRARVCVRASVCVCVCVYVCVRARVSRENGMHEAPLPVLQQLLHCRYLPNVESAPL